MANPYINIYMNNPTERDKDGTCVSTGGTYTAPISAVLNPDSMKGEYSKVLKLAVRTEEGYKTVGETMIYMQLSTDELSVARDIDFFYKLWWEPEYNEEGTQKIEGNVNVSDGKIITSNPISSRNKIFWLEMNCASDEEAGKIDRSIRLVVACTIEAESEAS